MGSLARENEHDREERDYRREAPKGLHGLEAGSRKCLDQGDRCDRADEHPEHRRAPHLIPRRQPRELHLDEVEVVLNAVEVAADLIGLTQERCSSSGGGMQPVCQRMVDETLEPGRRLGAAGIRKSEIARCGHDPGRVELRHDLPAVVRTYLRDNIPPHPCHCRFCDRLQRLFNK